VADDFVVLGVLQRDRFQIGRSERSGFCGERAVGGGPVGGRMKNAAGASATFGFRDGPSLRGGGDEYLTAGGADTAKGIPIGGRGRAATGALGTIFRFVEIGLFDANVFPIDVEFLCNEHGHGSFYALADFGIFCSDSKDVLGRDMDKGTGNVILIGGRGLCKETVEWIDVVGKEEAAACCGRNFEEAAAIETVDKHRGPPIGRKTAWRCYGERL